MYVEPNFPSKAALKRALAAGEVVTAFAPGLVRGQATEGVVNNGTAPVEGPHYPRPHTWYGIVTIKDGRVVKVV